MNSDYTNYTNYTYYIYSASIARIDSEHNLEIKNHQTEEWNKVQNADLYKRIMEDSELVTKEDADEFYKNWKPGG